MIHRPFLRSAIQVVGDFRIGDFDLQSYILRKTGSHSIKADFISRIGTDSIICCYNFKVQ